ncbi:hypothetical protein MRB53_040253 [Persea americana]|nr:hypothetical protein MRB53_040253 [Persea americana]
MAKINDALARTGALGLFMLDPAPSTCLTLAGDLNSFCTRDGRNWVDFMCKDASSHEAGGVQLSGLARRNSIIIGRRIEYTFSEDPLDPRLRAIIYDKGSCISPVSSISTRA